MGARWIEAFLEANLPTFRRLDLKHDVCANGEPHVTLVPGPRIGAIPLLSPATRKVAAGLLIEPRFSWAALGAVFDSIGFSVEPSLGGAPLVPGSAREVPPWLLAGPVIERLAQWLCHRTRSFVERTERRASPRGSIDWVSWASSQLPRGDWTSFPCRFSEPDDAPDILASIRWTLSRLVEELARVPWSLTARRLLRRAEEIRLAIGAGPSRRPPHRWTAVASSPWVAEAMEAMAWVAEERGLGGAKSLDGLTWDLSIDAVWEAWVASFAAELARAVGMVASPFRSARRQLRWEGPVRSMGMLLPDVELRASDRVVWIDAKYKAHFELLARKGWHGLSSDVQEQHRADLHQALAYASLADVPKVDSILVYPHIGGRAEPPATFATVTSGRRCVRLILMAVPFGYRSPEHKDVCLRSVRELLAA